MTACILSGSGCIPAALTRWPRTDFAVSRMTLRRVKLKAGLPKDFKNSGQVTEVAVERRGKYDDIMQIT